MTQSAKPKDSHNNGHNNDADHPHITDPIALGRILFEVSQQAQPILKDFLENFEFDFSQKSLDPMNLQEAYFDFLGHLWADPQKLMESQMKFWQDWGNLLQESATRFSSGSGDGEEIIAPEIGDRRFRAPIWQESALFDFIKQSYLLTARTMQQIVHDTEGMDKETKQKLEFYTRQFTNAIAPTNFLLTNPEVLQETLDTQGENLLKGLQNLVNDLERGHGELHISTTDHKSFELGKNLAVTPGKVIYQNDLMQLIQYEPKTEKVFKRPFLIVPPWINKYYILDLRPENSFINWMLEQGHTVFTISWVNPDRKLAKKRFENYMDEGVLEALSQIKQVTGEKDCNALGYCLGGTLLSTTLAWLSEKKRQDEIASATFLTTLVDFEQAGDLKLFIDEAQIALLDKDMEERGFLDADYLRTTFSLLRANDMIWSFVVNNYLMGREPFPFDLLYWNDDATNMPAAMHGFYLRKLYKENLLAKPGKVTMNGTPIDIGKVKTPAYFLSTKEDHIAPWKATYATTQLTGGDVTFTLAASGHVAGVINPPNKNKYCYWTSLDTPAEPEEWLSKANQHDGSWWKHWQKWLDNYAGEKTVPARKIKKSIEDAPGSYAKMTTPE